MDELGEFKFWTPKCNILVKHAFMVLLVPNKIMILSKIRDGQNNEVWYLKTLLKLRALALVHTKKKKKKKRFITFTHFCSKTTHISPSIIPCMYKIATVIMYIYTITVTFYLIF